MKFQKETFINASPETVFSFHELDDAFERLVPPWESVRLLQRADISKIGSRAVIEQKIFWMIKQAWVAEHTKYDPPRMFEDVQVEGPFKKWIHRHIVVPHESGAVLRDDIDFDPGFSFIGEIGAKLLILPKIESMFDYRHEVTKRWCEEAASASDPGAGI